MDIQTDTPYLLLAICQQFCMLPAASQAHIGDPMQPHSDLLIDRKRLKNHLTGWRFIALLAIFGGVAFYFSGFGTHGRGGIPGAYIAQINVEGIMFDDSKRDALIKELREDNNAKAVIVRMDSPGGTTVGGEVI